MITVRNQQLYALLNDGSTSAGTDATLPMLLGTVLHVNPERRRLYATSTDRFSLTQCWAPIENDDKTEDADDGLGAPVVIVPPAGVRMLKTMLAGAEPYDISDVAASDRFGTLKVTDRHSQRLGLTVPAEDVDYPAVGRLFANLAETRQNGAGEVTLSPVLVARLVAVAKRRREKLRFEFGRSNAVNVVHIGEQCRVLAMPIRVHEEPGEWVWSSPPVVNRWEKS
jgi:hypothetical protein